MLYEILYIQFSIAVKLYIVVFVGKKHTPAISSVKVELLYYSEMLLSTISLQCGICNPQDNSITPYEVECCFNNLSGLTLSDFYCRVIILYDKYLLPLPVSALNVLTQPTQTTAYTRGILAAGSVRRSFTDKVAV
jgi:hypothetical protein